MPSLSRASKWAIAFSAVFALFIAFLLVFQVIERTQAFACFVAGHVSSGMGKYETAERQFTRGLNLLPKGGDGKEDFLSSIRQGLYVGRASVRESLLRNEEALADLQAAIAAGDRLHETHDFRLRQLHSMERYDEAVAAARESAEVFPDDPYWRVEEGRGLWTKEDFSGAIAACDEGLKRFPANTELVELKVRVLQDSGRVEEGLQFIKDSEVGVSGPADQANLAILRSEIFWNQGRWEDSIAAASDAIRLAPQISEGHRRRYLGRMEARQYQGALEDCAKYLELDEAEPVEKAYVLGYAQLEAGLHLEAVGNLTIAATGHDDHEVRAYAALYRWYASALSEGKSRANGELNAVLKTVASNPGFGWVEQLSDLCQAPEREAEILAPFLKAPFDQLDETTRQNACEAFFFAGARRVVEGDVAGARPYFEKSRATKCKRFIEYDLSGGELHRLYSQAVAP